MTHIHTHAHYTNIGRDGKENEIERRTEKGGGVNSQKKKSKKWLRTGSDVRWREEE